MDDLSFTQNGGGSDAANGKTCLTKALGKITTVQSYMIKLPKSSFTLPRINNRRVFISARSLCIYWDLDVSNAAWSQHSNEFFHCLPISGNVLQNVRTNDNVERFARYAH